MQTEGQISTLQATGFIVSLVLPTAILFVPSITAQSAGPDAWLSLLLSLAFGLLVAVTASKLALRFPDETVVQYAPIILGSFFGKIVGFTYAFYFYYVAYFVLRQFGELMASVYMVETPLVIHVGLITLVGCYALYLGLEPLVRTNSMVVILLLVSIIIIFLVVVNSIHLDNFVPVLGTPPGQIILGALSPASWIGESAVILMLVPFLADKKKATTAAVYAVIIIFVSMLLITVGVVGQFGSGAAARMVFPTFSLARSAELQVAMALDRVDVLFMSVWVAGMTFKMTTFFYAGTLAFTQLFGLPSYRTLVIPGGVLLAALSLNSWDNIADLIEFSGQVFPPSITFVNFFLTTILLFLSFRKSRWESSGGQHD